MGDALESNRSTGRLNAQILFRENAARTCGLKPGHLAVWWFLAGDMDSRGLPYRVKGARRAWERSHASVAEHVGCGVTTARHWTADLVAAGWLDVHWVGGGRGHGNSYCLAVPSWTVRRTSMVVGGQTVRCFIDHSGNERFVPESMVRECPHPATRRTGRRIRRTST
jgi:hypothetical protein